MLAALKSATTEPQAGGLSFAEETEDGIKKYLRHSNRGMPLTDAEAAAETGLAL